MHTPEGTAQLLRDLVHEYTGSYFDASRLDTLLEKLEPLARERHCRSFLDYYYLLKFDGETVGEWARVMDALSVQETYFWREMDQINALAKIIVPAWFEKTSAPLRIWSAACATGEEPFTIAIALEEAGCFRRGPIEIIASDASGAPWTRRAEARIENGHFVRFRRNFGGNILSRFPRAGPFHRRCSCAFAFKEPTWSPPRRRLRWRSRR